jgi:hypothetical protein
MEAIGARLSPIMDSPAVSDTATDIPCHRQRRSATRRSSGLIRGLLVTALIIPAAGCVEEPLPQRKLTRNDCLREVKVDRIKEAIKRCDAVVAAFPGDPIPLNERFVLHSLNGDHDSACKDIARAAALARDIPPEKLDSLLQEDLKLRLASCKS